MRWFLISLILQFVLLASVAAQAPAPYSPGWLSQAEGTLAMQVLLVITTISGFLFQAWQMRQKAKIEERNRQWDLDDRERARKEAEAKANQRADIIMSVAAVAAKKSEQAVQKIDEQTAELTRKIDENSQLTEDGKKRLDAVLKRFAGDDHDRDAQASTTPQDANPRRNVTDASG